MSLSSSLSSRFRRYVDPSNNAPKSNSRASQAGVAAVAQQQPPGAGGRPAYTTTETSTSSIAGPRYGGTAGNAEASTSAASAARSPPSTSSRYGPTTLYEKTLPPAAAPRASAVPVSEAGQEYDEMQRAINASRQEQELQTALHESQDAQEQEALRRDRELQAERQVLESSRLEQERLENERAIAQAEEEQEVLRAIRESEALVSRQSATRAGKQRRRTTSVGHNTHGTHSAAGDSDAELEEAMRLSIQEEEEDQRRQHQEFERIRQESSPGNTVASTSARSPDPAEEDEEAILSAASAEAPPAYEPRKNGPTAAEDKNLIFYPPLADNEMTEGSMRVFVPHMLFAARSRQQRSGSDDFVPMASRDVDLKALPHTLQSSFSSKAPEPDVLSPAVAKKPRRPLPPLPPRDQATVQAGQNTVLPPLPRRPVPPPPSTTAGSYGFPRTVSPVPTMTSNDVVPSHSGTFGYGSQRTISTYDHDGTSTNQAAEDVHSLHSSGDPFDDSQASLNERDSGDDDDVASEDGQYYYNDRQQADQASGYRYAPEIMSAVAEPEDWRSQEIGSAHPTFSEITSTSGGTFRTARSDPSEPVRGEEALHPPSNAVARHDYTREISDTTGMPRAVSPEPVAAAEDGTINYDTDQSAISWESTGSEGEDDSPAAVEESALDINTNISFGFNPLSSPTKSLEWHGRFPDLILLSRHADERPGAVSTVGAKEDYRTFAWEAPTWRELLAYLMWHGNSLFQVSAADEVPGVDQHMSIILEFVRTVRPPATLVRLQVHLLGPAPATRASGAVVAGAVTGPASPSLVHGENGYLGDSASRGVALSRKPLSSRPTNYVQSSSPVNNGDAASKATSTHLVLAFPKPYQTLPCTLSTIASRLNSAQKTALARQHQLSRSPNGNARSTVQDGFLHDLLRGIEMCSDSRPSASQSSSGKPAQENVEGLDDSRFDRLRNRLRSQRQRLLKGTFRDLHKSTKSNRKAKYAKGSAQRRGSADSGESHLHSQPVDNDYHITPFRVDGR